MKLTERTVEGSPAEIAELHQRQVMRPHHLDPPALQLEPPATATTGLLYDCRACGHSTVAAVALEVLACLACGEEALRYAANCTLLTVANREVGR